MGVLDPGVVDERVRGDQRHDSEPVERPAAIGSACRADEQDAGHHVRIPTASGAVGTVPRSSAPSSTSAGRHPGQQGRRRSAPPARTPPPGRRSRRPRAAPTRRDTGRPRASTSPTSSATGAATTTLVATATTVAASTSREPARSTFQPAWSTGRPRVPARALAEHLARGLDCVRPLSPSAQPRDRSAAGASRTMGTIRILLRSSGPRWRLVVERPRDREQAVVEPRRHRPVEDVVELGSWPPRLSSGKDLLIQWMRWS